MCCHHLLFSFSSEPPSLTSIHAAFQQLVTAGALHSTPDITQDQAIRQSSVTSLGHFYSELPFSFSLSKIIATAMMCGKQI